jgi:hypothetical protein
MSRRRSDYPPLPPAKEADAMMRAIVPDWMMLDQPDPVEKPDPDAEERRD